MGTITKKYIIIISWTDGRTDRGKTVYPPPPSGSGGIMKNWREKGRMIRSKEKENFKHAGRKTATG
jgi:hypothetical protein